MGEADDLLLLLVPQVHKLSHGCRSVTCIMIVSKREDFSDALVEDESPQHCYPICQIALPVYNGLIPSRCLLLDAFAVSKPADKSEVGGNEVQRFLPFPRARHKARISERQRNIMLME